MDLLRSYDQQSDDNNVNIVGFTTKDIGTLNTTLPGGIPTRLMTVIPNEEWNPIHPAATIFLGVVHDSNISKVTYRWGDSTKEAVCVRGWWRPSDTPVLVDKDLNLAVKVETASKCIELAWLAIANKEHKKILADIPQIL